MTIFDPNDIPVCPVRSENPLKCPATAEVIAAAVHGVGVGVEAVNRRFGPSVADDAVRVPRHRRPGEGIHSTEAIPGIARAVEGGEVPSENDFRLIRRDDNCSDISTLSHRCERQQCAVRGIHRCSADAGGARDGGKVPSGVDRRVGRCNCVDGRVGAWCEGRHQCACGDVEGRNPIAGHPIHLGELAADVELAAIRGRRD